MKSFLKKISVGAIALLLAFSASAASKLTMLSTVASYAVREVSPEEVLKKVVEQAKEEKIQGKLPVFEKEENASDKIYLSDNLYSDKTLKEFFKR